MESCPQAPLPAHPNAGPGNVAVVIVLLVLSLLVVTVRMIIKSCLIKKIGWDDWTIVFAMVRGPSLQVIRLAALTALAQLGTAIGSGLDFVEVHYGFGRPDDELCPAQLVEFAKYSYGEWIQTFATLMWTKVSICLLLLHIPTSKAIIRTLHSAIAFLIVSNVALTLLWIFQCHPIHKYWSNPFRDEPVPGYRPNEGSCFSRDAVLKIIFVQASEIPFEMVRNHASGLRYAVISIVSDFVLASYPILILWKVQLKFRTKVGLCCMMGLGVL